LLVIAASACHYYAIVWLIMPPGSA